MTLRPPALSSSRHGHRRLTPVATTATTTTAETAKRDQWSEHANIEAAV
jgi:hypothetical protein